MPDHHDDFSRTAVNENNLKPWWYLLIIEMGVMISIPIFIIGGQLGRSLSLNDLVLATLAGALILGIVGGLTARLGSIMRCSTALMARLTFGKYGAFMLALVLALAMTGWWGVQTELFSNAVIALAKDYFHFHIARELMIFISGTAMITTAALGIRAIGKLSYLAVPLLLCGLVYALYNLICSAKFNAIFTYQPPTDIASSIGAAAATVAGGFIVGASCNPDLARFARNTKHALAYSIGDYSFAYPLLLVACGVLAIGLQTNDVMRYFVAPNFSWLLFIMMMFATWAANDCNLYSSSLSLATLFPKLSRSRLAIGAGVLGIFLAQNHVSEHMIWFLTLLGVVIAPISGIFVIEGFSRSKAVSQEELEHIPNWRIPQVLAWLFGIILGLAATPKSALGFGLFTLTTLPTLDSIIAASLFLLLFNALAKLAMKEKDKLFSSETQEII